MIENKEKIFVPKHKPLLPGIKITINTSALKDSHTHFWCNKILDESKIVTTYNGVKVGRYKC